MIYEKYPISHSASSEEKLIASVVDSLVSQFLLNEFISFKIITIPFLRSKHECQMLGLLILLMGNIAI
ncbi:hypothetical protein SSUD9_1131 [Streptococcus suis D9]|nr:hypothetical protein SSUD9_1131 [Streptococcus suis D9]